MKAGGPHVPTDVVLVSQAHQHTARTSPAAGTTSRLPDVIDTSGRFSHLHSGRYVTGTWRRSVVAHPLGFPLTDGQL